MAKRKVIILGGGVSGLSLAWKLASENIEVEILEAAPQIGGLSATFREGDYALDYGPHSFFTEDHEILGVYQDLFGHSAVPLTRKVKFCYKGKYLDYPLTPASILFQMGVISGVRASLSFLKEKLFHTHRIHPYAEDVSVEDWAISNFGNHLYRTFFKPYTEQFWKVQCSELSAKSIPSHTRTSFFNTLKVLLNRRVTKEGSSLIEREKLPTYYPKTGYGELPDRISEQISREHVRIQASSRATKVDRESRGKMRVQYVRDREEKETVGDYVVSTIPLRYFIQMLGEKASDNVVESANQLDYRPLLVLGMVTEKQNVLGDSMYMYQMDRPYNRIFEMNKFSPETSPRGDNILAAEITCQRDSVVWQAPKEELFDMCIGSLSEDGFLSPGEVKKLMLVKAPYAYPIYKKDYAPHLETVLNFVRQFEGVATLGRTGEFIYMDADKCMRRAFDLANIIKQELARSTETLRAL